MKLNVSLKWLLEKSCWKQTKQIGNNQKTKKMFGRIGFMGKFIPNLSSWQLLKGSGFRWTDSYEMGLKNTNKVRTCLFWPQWPQTLQRRKVGLMETPDPGQQWPQLSFVWSKVKKEWLVLVKGIEKFCTLFYGISFRKRHLNQLPSYPHFLLKSSTFIPKPISLLSALSTLWSMQISFHYFQPTLSSLATSLHFLLSAVSCSRPTTRLTLELCFPPVAKPQAWLPSIPWSSWERPRAAEQDALHSGQTNLPSHKTILWGQLLQTLTEKTPTAFLRLAVCITFYKRQQSVLNA